MFFIVLLGNLGFSLTSLALGVRLVRLSQRTHELPETLMGYGFVTGGFAANTLAWLYYLLRPQEPLLTPFLYLLRATAAIACGMVAVVAWRVFRKNEGWAKALMALEVVLLLSYVFRGTLLGASSSLDDLTRSVLYWANTAALALPYFWGTFEAWDYQAQIGKRWAIGLPADLVLAARMRLWALGLGAIGSMLVSLDLVRRFGFTVGVDMFPSLMISTLGLTCAICLWLAFFLPAPYVARIERQASSPPLQAHA
jgi:hypothetical protein